MKCDTFQSLISDYFDGLLDRKESSAFCTHALKCPDCRVLMDQVRQAIDQCKNTTSIETPVSLDAVLQSIPDEHAQIDCGSYQELITEFLDGFVPAPLYHRFEEHAEFCASCSELLTGVVYAVAACHGVHVYEEVDVPSELSANLIGIAVRRQKRLGGLLADKARAAAERLIPSPTGRSRRLAMGLSLAAFTFAFLLLGFSDDGTVNGIYRQARVKASAIYNRGSRAYSEKDRLVAELEGFKSDVRELWSTLGGTEAAPKNDQTTSE